MRFAVSVGCASFKPVDSTVDVKVDSGGIRVGIVGSQVSMKRPSRFVNGVCHNDLVERFAFLTVFPEDGFLPFYQVFYLWRYSTPG